MTKSIYPVDEMCLHGTLCSMPYQTKSRNPWYIFTTWNHLATSHGPYGYRPSRVASTLDIGGVEQQGFRYLLLVPGMGKLFFALQVSGDFISCTVLYPASFLV